MLPPHLAPAYAEDEAFPRSTCHRHGLSPPLTHRDVKLENILLAEGGVWKLCASSSTSTSTTTTATSTSTSTTTTATSTVPPPLHRHLLLRRCDFGSCSETAGVLQTRQEILEEQAAQLIPPPALPLTSPDLARPRPTSPGPSRSRPTSSGSRRRCTARRS